MRVHTKLAPNPDPDLRKAAEAVASNVAQLMSIHGIATLVAVPAQVGPRSVLQKSYEDMQMSGIPAALGTVQAEAASLLASYMSLFGIVEIAAVTTAEERRALLALWRPPLPVKAGTDAAPTGKAVEVELCPPGP